MGRFNFDLGYALMHTHKNKQFAAEPLIDGRDTLASHAGSRVQRTLGWSPAKRD